MGIRATSKLVHELLITEPKCRNSDNYLYLRVLELVGKQNGIDIQTMTVPTLLCNMSAMKLPPFESVRRSRQKLQEHNEDLRATESVEAEREILEEEYREYARGCVV